MNPTEQQVRVTAKLYECRDAVKSLLGDRYKERMAELGLTITTVAKHRNCELAHAANLAARACDGGFDRIQVLAAFVELVEPSA